MGTSNCDTYCHSSVAQPYASRQTRPPTFCQQTNSATNLLPADKLVSENGSEDIYQAVVWLDKASCSGDHRHLEGASDPYLGYEGLEAGGEAEWNGTVGIEHT